MWFRILTFVIICHSLGFIKCFSQKQNFYDRIVEVKGTFQDSKQGSYGTGFCFQDEKIIITALHVVAGCNHIEVRNSENDYSEAYIVRVHFESDLVLLKLKKDLDLTPFSETLGTLSNNDVYKAWGFPGGIIKAQAPEIKFNESNQDYKIKYYKKELTFFKNLINQGYPSIDAKIYPIGSVVTHGLSGAPIVNNSGQIIGIVNGGLRDGTIGLNWAMKSSYIDALLNSNDDLRKVKKSGIPYLSNKVERIGESSYITLTTTLKKLVSTLDSSKKVRFSRFIENERYTNCKWDSLSVDIYEDYSSGASIALPRNIKLKGEFNKGLIVFIYRNMCVTNKFICSNSFPYLKERMVEFENDAFKFGPDWLDKSADLFLNYRYQINNDKETLEKCWRRYSEATNLYIKFKMSIDNGKLLSQIIAVYTNDKYDPKSDSVLFMEILTEINSYSLH